MKNSEVADIVRALMKGVITQRHAIKKLEKLVDTYQAGYLKGRLDEECLQTLDSGFNTNRDDL